MGLDISAYEKVTLKRAVGLKERNAEDLDEADDEVYLYYDRGHDGYADGLSEGVYIKSGKSHSFRAGSYSGYNIWRAKLAQMIGTTDTAIWDAPPPTGPFLELINNSDCEGFIGPKTCAKLAKDFDRWRDRAIAFAADLSDEDNRAWFLAKYDEWHKAFALAAGNGAVKLH